MNTKILIEFEKKIENLYKEAKIRGPIPLPTKRLKVPTRKTPCGEGSISWDHYQLRLHKRLIDIAASDRIMRSLMRLAIPSDVFIEISLK